MPMPNGPGALLSKAQANIVSQTGVKLFQADKPDPVQQAAKKELAERAVKPKIKPTPTDLLKLSGASSLGFLLLNDTIGKLGKDLSGAKSGAKELETGFIKNMFGEKSLVSSLMTGGVEGAGGALAKQLAKKFGPKITTLLGGAVGKAVLGGGMIAAGVILGVVDGLKGAKKAKEWGVGKFNAGVAAGLTSSSKGPMGAAAGATKYGLIGMGIGTLILPGVGTAIGGAIGAGVGMILGAVGGERTAKFFQRVGKKVSGAWDKYGGVIVQGVTLGVGLLAGGPLGAGIAMTMHNLVKSGKMQAIWKSDSPLGKKLLMSVGAIGVAAWDTIAKPLAAGIGLLDKGIEAITTRSDGSKNLLGKADEFMTSLPGKLLEGIDSIGSLLAGDEAWSGIKDYFNDAIIGGFMRLFTDVGGWIQSIFGLNNEAKSELKRAEWERDFKDSDEYKKHLESLKQWERSGKVGAEPESKKAYLDRMWQEHMLSVDDGIFTLNKTLSAGSLFQQNQPMKFNNKDELYLMASTNPARDALVTAVESLTSLVGELATAVQAYKPVTNNMQTSIENTAIPLRELLTRPGVYSI